jgi:hypothetical protein
MQFFCYKMTAFLEIQTLCISTFSTILSKFECGSYRKGCLEGIFVTERMSQTNASTVVSTLASYLKCPSLNLGLETSCHDRFLTVILKSFHVCAGPLDLWTLTLAVSSDGNCQPQRPWAK